MSSSPFHSLILHVFKLCDDGQSLTLVLGRLNPISAVKGNFER